MYRNIRHGLPGMSAPPTFGWDRQEPNKWQHASVWASPPPPPTTTSPWQHQKWWRSIIIIIPAAAKLAVHSDNR